MTNPVICTRRAAVGGTLVAGLWPRKPYAAGLDKLQRHDPPRPLPEAEFRDAEGAPVTLAAFRDQGVVLNLWATWCAPCVAEMPSLQRLAGLVRQDRIMVLPLSSDRGGAPAVRAFYDRLGLKDLGIWLDPRGAAARSWGARGLPTTLLIGRDGTERGRLEGEATWDAPEMVAQVRALLA